MAVTKKQLANLRPIKKGEIRNPNGGRSHNPILRALRNLTRDEFAKMIELAVLNNVAGLKAVVSDPNSSALQVGIAMAMLKASSKGDWTIIESIVSRVIGKMPDLIEMKTNNETTVTVLDHAKIVEANKKLENDY